MTVPTGEPGRQGIAIVGSGPRGLTVLERLAARLGEETVSETSKDALADGPLDIYLIDAVQVGCGRIWQTGQPEWFLMNTVAGEITAYSGLPDSGPYRPGAGPPFAQWWSEESGRPRDNDYAPRATYGRYLTSVLDTIEAALPDRVTLHRITDRVRRLDRTGAGYRLELAGGRTLEVARAVLVTGHSQPELVGALRDLQTYAEGHPDLRFLAGDSAADLPLADIPAGSAVGVLGLGLTFYDVMSALTLGRGGRFEQTPTGTVYHPSGREPMLFAGSRSGMPQPARGRNQKPAAFRYRQLYLTPELVRRDAAGRPVDFRRDLLPRLMAEVDLAYFAALLRDRDGGPAAERLLSAAHAAGGNSVQRLYELAAECGLAGVPGLDFDQLSLPFAGRTFDDPAEFEACLRAEITADLAEAERGNLDSPRKAALDMLRSFRWMIRELADFGGLAPDSHKYDLIGWYAPRSSFLAAGPPLARLAQVLALIDAGVLRLVGPQVQFAIDPELATFVVSSPVVADSSVAVRTVIDARIPSPDLSRDRSPLARQLVADGLWTEFVNRHPEPDSAEADFATGGVAVTPAPFHPIGADGSPDRGLHVLGIPTEHTRFFTQVVATGPTSWSEVMLDADAVAGDLLAGLRSPATDAAGSPTAGSPGAGSPAAGSHTAGSRTAELAASR